MSDRQAAEKASAGMSGRDTGETHLHVAYMEGVTRKLVHLYSREIVAVASELYQRHVLTGDEVRPALRSAYPPIKRSAACGGTPP